MAKEGRRIPKPGDVRVHSQDGILANVSVEVLDDNEHWQKITCALKMSITMDATNKEVPFVQLAMILWPDQVDVLVQGDQVQAGIVANPEAVASAGQEAPLDATTPAAA